jgi:hypothetical protein
MADHLPLPAPLQLRSRRQGAGAPPRPQRDAGRHGRKLADELDTAAQAQRPARIIEGVDPALVFKVRAITRIDDAALRNRGLHFLGDTKDWTYFVLLTGDDPSALRAELARYAQTSELRTFFEAVEEVLPYGREDRRDAALPGDGDPLPEEIIVDAIAWPSANRGEAERRLGNMRAAVESGGGQVLGFDPRSQFTILRARVGRDALDALLDVPVVELVRLPPLPRLEPSDWTRATPDDLPDVTEETVAPIGVIDDLVQDHPLLNGLVASRESLPDAHAWLPPSDHGTMVAGLLAYGDFEEPFARGTQLTACGPIHAVRVLEPDPNNSERTRFPTDEPVHLVMERAITTLNDEHGVRVFNLSIADDHAYSGPHVSAWTERMDELARERDLVIVQASGNHAPGEISDALPSGANVLTGYYGYLLGDSARVAEPAAAANVLSVGSVAHSHAPVTPRGESRPGDRAIARTGQPSPFTRTGPGAGGSIKPEIIHDGGNWVLNDVDVLEDRNYGVSALSLVMHPERMFGVASGTSFAAPRVARLAGRILGRYPAASANLVRSLVGASCRIPEPSADLLANQDDCLRTVGYGRPIDHLALESSPGRVTLIYEGIIPADTVAIHPVPIPEPFARGRAARTITVALAFDPSVRRQRREYLAASMRFDLLRNVDPDTISDIYSRQTEQRENLIRDRRNLNLRPGVTACDASTLQVRTVRHRELNVDDGDTYYLVVTHRNAPWAEGGDQRYALAVVLEEEERQDVDLYALVQAQLEVPIRVRVR